jgi:glycosyltransferase involved in cell wall biosynthesis
METMSSPIRVLELRSVRGAGGGPEKTILHSARLADPSKFAITVCYIRDARDEAFAMDVRAGQIGVDYVEIPERNSFDPSIFPKLRSLVRERAFHIVHVHEYKTDLLGWMLAKVEKVIPLATAHGWTGRLTSRERIYYAVDKRLLARYPRVITVSSEIQSELVRYGCRPDKITVLPNAIDHTAYSRDVVKRRAIRQTLSLSDEETVIGAVGRLESVKRFDLLMEAVARLLGRYPRLRLLIAGEGGRRDELTALQARFGLGSACRLLGQRSDVPLLHQAFDLFVQSSDDEGTANALLEAMALKTPVVATNVGGTRELVTDGAHGLLIRPGDSAVLAEAIERCLVDPDAAAVRASAARRRVEGELSFERRRHRVEEIYQELVSRPQQRVA